MKAVCMKVVKSVSVDETKTTVVFKVDGYTPESLTMDGQHRVEPGQTLMITVSSVLEA